MITKKLNQDRIIFDGEVELDESYFGGRRKGKRGRGSGGKRLGGGLYKRNGYVKVEIVRSTGVLEIFPIIKQKVKLQSTSLYGQLS